MSNVVHLNYFAAVPGEHIGGAKAHFTDQTDGIYHQPAATGEHDVFMFRLVS